MSVYMVAHLALLYAIHIKHPFWVRHRHAIVTVDRICSFMALAQVRRMQADTCIAPAALVLDQAQITHHV